ncbi:MAG: hypothetical protein JRF25_03340, partial [Deltaproteobacteria bacterium]|nr:hypothetical protein [Deltaproteobacteria bacterium]
SNLDITDAVAVAKANELCNNYGLDTIGTGGVVAYVFEAVEKGLISSDDVGHPSPCFGNADALFWLIEKITAREGIGDVLADGLTSAVKAFGEKTAPFAIHVKNKVPAVHMAQVKPSQALMYAVCPIGADHMSSEHDWLLASEADFSRGGFKQSANDRLQPVLLQFAGHTVLVHVLLGLRESLYLPGDGRTAFLHHRMALHFLGADESR